MCAGQGVVVDFAAGSHNIREYDPATFNVFNPVYLGDAYSARLSGTHTVSGLGASRSGTRHYICAYHETAKFDTECVHTPDDAPLLECLDVACDNGAAQTLCSGDDMSVGVQTGAIGPIDERVCGAAAAAAIADCLRDGHGHHAAWRGH